MAQKQEVPVYRVTVKPRNEHVGVKVVVVWVEGIDGGDALLNLSLVIPDLLKKMRIIEMEAI